MKGKLNLHFQLEDVQGNIMDTYGVDVYMTSLHDNDDKLNNINKGLSGLCRDFSNIIYEKEIWGEEI